jgi:hypothetical protein
VTVTARTKTRFLGWSLIGIIGGGAVLISLVTLALGVVVADVFVLEKTPTQTTYLTIVRLKGTVASGQDGWYVYEVKNADGTVHDAQLPWTAEPGDRVRM